MKTQPFVSVIIPTYNRSAILCETIHNVFQQTYSNFELIVVDDGSTDDTQTKLRHFGDRIRVVKQKNSGPAAARNHGVRVARGEIIAFQDSDDLWKPTKLVRQVRLLEANKSIPCCLCNIVLRTVNGKDYTSFEDSLVFPRNEEGIWLNVPEVLATRFVFFNQAVAIRREAWEEVGGFDESLKYFEDYDLPMRLSFLGPWAFIREPLVTYGHLSPLRFSQASAKDPVTLLQCALKICERSLEEGKSLTRQGTFQRCIKWRMKSLHRELKAMRLSEKGSLGARAVAEFLLHVEHYRRAGFRRSPWFPSMIESPI